MSRRLRYYGNVYGIIGVELEGAYIRGGAYNRFFPHCLQVDGWAYNLEGYKWGRAF